MNIAIFTGRLGRDAEFQTFSAGRFVKFSIAVDIGWGEDAKTMWVECAYFGKRAEGVEPYLTKGLKVTVHGRISLNEFTDKNGVAKTALNLDVIDLELPPKERASDGGSTYERPAPRRAEPATKARAGDINDMDDDLPF